MKRLVWALLLAALLACGGCNPQPTAKQTEDCQARGGHMQQTGAGGWACLPPGGGWQ